MSRPAIPQQVVRLAIAFALAAVAYAIARSALVPETFGEAGHYRRAAVDSIQAREVKYAGIQDCLVCHPEIDERRVVGNHKGLACEICHGPSAEHSLDPETVTPIAPRDRGFCPLCHSYDAARPTGFPQIDPVAHNPLDPCITCHDPHQPVPPSTPEECSACHGQISRQKAVSHHARLECRECHETPDEHKVAPRSATPGRPTERAFCGKCHAQSAPEASRIPQISLETHYPTYLCWQCHYPHNPEAGFR